MHPESLTRPRLHRGLALVALVGAALILMSAVPLAADELELPPGRWWENEQVQAEVQLTDEQQQRIHELVYDHAHRMIDLAATVKKTELDLRDLADRPDFDPAAARAAFARFQKARQALELERFELLLSIRQTLSAEQWQALSALRREHLRRRADDGRRPGIQRPGTDRTPRRR